MHFVEHHHEQAWTLKNGVVDNNSFTNEWWRKKIPDTNTKTATVKKIPEPREQ